MSATKEHNKSWLYVVAGILTVFGVSLYLQNKRRERIHRINRELDEYVNNPWIGFDKIGQDFRTVGKDIKKVMKDYEKESIQF